MYGIDLQRYVSKRLRYAAFIPFSKHQRPMLLDLNTLPRLPPPQIPIESQLTGLVMERRRHLRKPWHAHRMPQIHRTADVLIHLQVPRYKCKRAHEISRPPGGSVGFRGVDGVVTRRLDGGPHFGRFLERGTRRYSVDFALCIGRGGCGAEGLELRFEVVEGGGCCGSGAGHCSCDGCFKGAKFYLFLAAKGFFGVFKEGADACAEGLEDFERCGGWVVFGVRDFLVKDYVVFFGFWIIVRDRGDDVFYCGAQGAFAGLIRFIPFGSFCGIGRRGRAVFAGAGGEKDEVGLDLVHIAGV